MHAPSTRRPHTRGLSLATLVALCTASGPAAAAAPNVSIDKVHPNQGTAAAPRVWVERIRRSTGDAGLVNFEVDFRNNEATTRELSQLRTSYTGPGALPAASFDAFTEADLLRHSNGALGPRGSEPLTDTTDTTIGSRARAAAISTSGGHYLVAGQATTGDDGEDRLHLARVSRTSAAILAQRTAFPGATSSAEAVAIVPGVTNKIIVAGQYRDAQNVAYLGLAQFLDDETLTPDPSFNGAGTLKIGLPGCGDETITDLVVTGSGSAQRTTVTGWGTCSGARKGFIARFRQTGSLDTTLDGDGIFMLPTPFNLGVRGVAVRVRDEWVPPGDVMEPRIYVASELGDHCDSEQAGECYVLVSRHKPNGALDTTFAGSGTRLVAFPSSSGQVPVGLELLANGKLLVAATRFASNGGQAHVGVAQLTGAGAIDTSFAASGYATSQFSGRPISAVDLAVDASGQIFVGGVTLGAGPREVGLIGFTAGGAWWSSRGNRVDADADMTMHDLLIDAQGKLLVAGQDGPWGQLVRFRGDGRLDWRGVLDSGETQQVFWPDARELPLPFATDLALGLTFVGNPTAITVAAAVDEPSFRVTYPWSYTDAQRAWSTGGHHQLRDVHRGNNGQRYAHDMGVLRHNGSTWTDLKAGTSGKNNSDYEIWGEPIAAGASGRVLACWRSAPNNAAPDESSTTAMPGGGNMFYIENPVDKTVALYAHLQAGSVSTDACPNDCTHHDDNGAAWRPDLGSDTCSHWLDPSVNHMVTVGDPLGAAGNSGNSSKPHFHFHLTRSPTGVNDRANTSGWVGVPAYFDATWTDERSKTPANLALVPLSGEATAAPKALLWRPAPIP